MRLLNITRRLLLYFILTFCVLSAVGQTTTKTLEGRLLDENNKPIPFATVAIKKTTVGTVSNNDGYFSFEVKPQKNIFLQVSCIGYQTKELKLSAQSFRKQLKVILKKSLTTIEEVIVTSKSQITLKKELPFSLEAIDAKPLQIRNLDVNELLSTTTGVKIRQEGGLGSGFVFSLNGFSGNQIKFFMDGVAMDNFGSSLSLNNIPVNLISSIEVYKGVIPIELGADALGGAVNIITNQSTKNYLDVAYSIGSFNTHRASVISRYTSPTTGIRINTNAFYNYSDNNYKILVEIPDAETGKVDDRTEVERFNDGYHSITGQLEIGVVDKSYADKLFLGLTMSSNYKEIQTGYNMTKVAGDVHTKSKRTIVSLKYDKQDFFIEKLHAKLNASYINGTDLVVDTSSYEYDWYGNTKLRDLRVNAGELNWYKTEFRFNDKSTQNTVNLSYELAPGHSIAINNTFSYLSRVGEDPIGYYAVPFNNPNKVSKNISGLSYNQNLLGGKLKSSVFGKFFYMNANMYKRLDSSEDGVELANNQYKNTGIGLAIAYFILPDLQVKTSFENTYRLPETDELFGDGLQVLANPNLEPERSKNFNIGFSWRKQIRSSNFTIESAYLFRLPENYIMPALDGPRSISVNYTNAKINSVEADVRYNFENRLRVGVNATYQNIVDNKETTSTGGMNYLYADRLPNIPYLFGNASIGFQFPLSKNEENKASIDWNTHFVEEFYLKSPSLGSVDSKYVIPRQVSHSVSVSFLFNKGKYNLSAACTNLMNNELYDNFKLQKPGRAFSVKFRYFISKR